MRAINAAYAVLSDPARRATYDARHYLPRAQTVTVVTPARAKRPVAVEVAANPPTKLQRRVDRIVAVLGVLLLVAIGFYTVNVIPYAEQQLRSSPPPPRAVEVASAPAAPADPAQTANVTVPDRLRADSLLRNFPGTVLVAPSGLEPFASLPILRLEAASQGIARYAIYYGDLTTGGATISGLIGRASFDSGAPRLPDCAPESPYCAGPVPGQPSGQPGLELFRGLSVIDEYPAFVTHRVCCNGVFWSLSWYASRTNMSYTIDLSRSAATRFGSATAADDVAAAHAVAALASQLVRLP